MKSCMEFQIRSTQYLFENINSQMSLILKVMNVIEEESNNA